MILLPPPTSSFEWLLEFEDEIFNYPNSRHDDQTDVFSMAIDFCHIILQQGYEESHPLPEGPIIHDVQWWDEELAFKEKYGMSREMYQRLSGYDL